MTKSHSPKTQKTTIDYSYTLEKLTQAMAVLTIHHGDARERLNAAFLNFHTLKQEDFPKHLQKKWKWVIKEITKFGPLLDHEGKVWRGSVENTLRRIRKKSASKIIAVIHQIYWEISDNKQYR